MTQREAGYRGGIQTGTTASSSSSVAAEKVLRVATSSLQLGATESLVAGLSSNELKSRLKLTSNTDLAGVYPDGGIVIDHDSGSLLLAAESKKQGPGGNAIERWFKNYATLMALDLGIYVTTCVGDGFFDSNTANRVMNLAQVLHGASCPSEPAAVWNTECGSLWIYRFRTNEELESFDLNQLLANALVAGRSKSNHATTD